MSDDTPTKEEHRHLISFSVWEEIGFPVYRVQEGLRIESQDAWNSYRDDAAHMLLTKNSLKAGDQILVGPNEIVDVKAGKNGDLHGISPNGKLSYFLHFDTDRPVGPSCWKCGGVGNLTAIRKLKLHREKETQ